MNNKKTGTDFEKQMCDDLAARGFWVHFLNPDRRGAQPFDIVAIKNGRPYAIECKTLANNKRVFDISRIENNQIMAFERWISCGNPEPMIFVKWKDYIVMIGWTELKHRGKINMQEAANADHCWE